MKKKLKLAFDQLEMDMDLLPNTELGQYNGGTGSVYGGGEAFYNWYINGGYEYGGSAAYFYINGAGGGSTGSESGNVDNETEYWVWGGSSWVWMGSGTPDENATRYSSDLPEVVIVVNGNNQSFQNPYTVWYNWIQQEGGWFSGSGNGSGSSGNNYSTAQQIVDSNFLLPYNASVSESTPSGYYLNSQGYFVDSNGVLYDAVTLRFASGNTVIYTSPATMRSSKDHQIGIILHELVHAYNLNEYGYELSEDVEQFNINSEYAAYSASATYFLSIGNTSKAAFYQGKADELQPDVTTFYSQNPHWSML
jgi:hypothetical protein